jgi:two-component system LytT family sensor kinase
MFTASGLKFVILGWAGASLFFTAVLMVSELGGHKPLGFALYANAVHFALWTVALPLLSKCATAFPLSRGSRVWNVSALLLMVIVLGAAVMVSQWAILYSTYFPYHEPGGTLLSFLQTESVRFLSGDVLIGIGLVLAIEGRRVWQDFQAERLRSSDLERQLAVAQLHALRMQLHPHFLFNTLHAIAGLIVEQPPTARRMVVALGDLLRLTLKDTGSPVRSLAEELEFADLYLGIEKLRLGDRLMLDYDIESEATSAEVPQILLQPMFENAVRHGAARTVHTCGVGFRGYRRGDQLHLILNNDGPVRPPAPDPPPFGVGLTNTLDRLRLHYKDQFTFRYTDRPQGGAQIDISIPYKKAENEKISRPKEPYAAVSGIHAHTNHR